ncbi:MAG: Disulfide bond formation protein D precursor [Microgenomates bacterium OLB23]|nr:MAG: Disulfide bond formation protein D precursor [Microgenomates bacterium OLB23]
MDCKLLLLKTFLTMNALMENKLVAGTIVAVLLFVGLFGVWKMINGTTSTSTDTNQPVIDLKVTNDDWQKGSASASATLVEYSDFQCPACKAYAPLVEAFADKNKDKVRLVYRHFPLQQHKNALPASLFAEAAGMQGKFFEMHDKLFEGQSEWDKVSDPEKVFIKYAEELKLDIAKLKADAASQKAKDSVNQDMASGNSAGVQATPTFFMNGKKIVSPQSLEDFEKLLQ